MANPATATGLASNVSQAQHGQGLPLDEAIQPMPPNPQLSEQEYKRAHVSGIINATIRDS